VRPAVRPGCAPRPAPARRPASRLPALPRLRRAGQIRFRVLRWRLRSGSGQLAGRNLSWSRDLAPVTGIWHGASRARGAVRWRRGRGAQDRGARGCGARGRGARGRGAQGRGARGRAAWPGRCRTIASCCGIAAVNRNCSWGPGLGASGARSGTPGRTWRAGPDRACCSRPAAPPCPATRAATWSISSVRVPGGPAHRRPALPAAPPPPATPLPIKRTMVADRALGEP
jgi:hypothetical protein